MRKKLSVIVLIFYLAAVLAESAVVDDVEVNTKSVNIVDNGVLNENADFSGSCEEAKSLEKGIC
jgi:hypothetical protein